MLPSSGSPTQCRKNDLFLINTKVLPRIAAVLEEMEDSCWIVDDWVSWETMPFTNLQVASREEGAASTKTVDPV